MTFAVLGSCPLRGQSGAAITTSSQNITDPSLGPSLLDHMDAGETPAAAMEAVTAAGGEEGGNHSAAILVARDPDWANVNLCVDWTEGDPIWESNALKQTYLPQMGDYLACVLDPDAKPGCGVPGDE